MISLLKFEIPSFKYQSRKINQSIYSLGRRVLFLFHRQLFQCHHHHRNTKKIARVHKKFLKVHFGISTAASDSRGKWKKWKELEILRRRSKSNAFCVLVTLFAHSTKEIWNFLFVFPRVIDEKPMMMIFVIILP